MQAGTVLEPRTFPTERLYEGTEDDVELAAVLADLSATVHTLNHSGLVKKVTSFGFAMANPIDALVRDRWNEPNEFLYIVCGWGMDGPRYTANAVRKLRPALRLGRDTLDIQRNDPGSFLDPVDSQTDDGKLLWGDFPWGGAVRLPYGGHDYYAAVSCFTAEEDHAVAAMLLALVLQRMEKVGKLPAY